MKTWLRSASAPWVLVGLTVLIGVTLGLLAVAWFFWSAGHPRQYDFACWQGDGGTTPSLIESIPKVLPAYSYDGSLNSCDDGSGWTLIFSSTSSWDTDAAKALQGSSGCNHVRDLVYDCTVDGNRVEMMAEDQAIYATALSPDR